MKRNWFNVMNQLVPRQYDYMHSLKELCSELDFGVSSEFSTCPCLKQWRKITDGKMSFSSVRGDDMHLFAGLIQASFQFDTLWRVRNWTPAADRHLGKMDNRTALLISDVMYALPLIRCMLSIMVMLRFFLRGREKQRILTVAFMNGFVLVVIHQREGRGACAHLVSNITPNKAYTCQSILISHCTVCMSWLQRAPILVGLICLLALQLSGYGWIEAIICLCQCRVNMLSDVQFIQYVWNFNISLRNR